jgi:hypothetical protein
MCRRYEDFLQRHPQPNGTKGERRRRRFQVGATLTQPAALIDAACDPFELLPK